MKNGKFSGAKKRRTSPIVLIGAAIMIVAGILIFSLAGSGAKLDPFDYISVSFSGYDSNGRAEVKFMKPDLIEDILMEDSDGDTAWFIQYDVYDRGIQLECTPKEGLSNGDKVRVTVSVSDKAKKHVKGGEQTFRVSGLPEVEPIDIFQDAELIVEGMGGEAWARMQVPQDNEILRHCNFQVEPQMNLRNGDTVTVTLKNPEALAEKYLVMPKETVKTFTVSGLEEYLTDSDLLPEDQIREIIDRFLVDSIRKDWSWHHYTMPEYYKTYFLTAQEGSFLTEDNMLQIYVHIEQYDREEFAQDLYVPLVFNNVVLHADGTVNLNYESGVSIGFLTDPESILEQEEDGYDVEEIYIEY